MILLRKWGLATLLSYLADQAGRLIDKEELLREVWPDVVVAESSPWRSIAGLRKALGDDHYQPEILETLPRRGYRLIAPVAPSALPPAPKASSEHSAGRPGSRQPALIVGGILLIALAVGVWRAAVSSNQVEVPAAQLLPTEVETESDALSLVQHGTEFLARDSEEDTASAIRLFEQAISKDPNLAIAHAGLATAQSYRARWFGGDPGAGLAAAQRSVTLDPELAAAHEALGTVYLVSWRLSSSRFSR